MMECGDCGIKLSTKSNLKRHFKVVHDVLITSDRTSVVCPLCEKKGDRPSLLNHFEKIHKIKVKTERLTFSNMKSFEEWKSDVENVTISKFIKSTNDKIKKSSVYSYYKCHRDGHFSPEGSKIRNLKRKGSNKINGFCPASISVSSKGNEINVKFISTHVGHEMQLDRIPLLRSERKEIAKKIKAKIPFEKILHDFRKSAPPGSRLRLITRQDLRNAKRCLIAEGKMESTESATDEEWADTTENEEPMIDSNARSSWDEETVLEEPVVMNSSQDECVAFDFYEGASNNIKLVIQYASEDDENRHLDLYKASVIEDYQKVIELIKASNSFNDVKEAENRIKSLIVNGSLKMDEFSGETSKKQSADTRNINDVKASDLRRELTEDGLIIL